MAILDWRLWDHLDELSHGRVESRRRALTLLPAMTVLLVAIFIFSAGVSSLLSGAWVAASLQLGAFVLFTAVRVGAVRSRSSQRNSTPSDAKGDALAG